MTLHLTSIVALMQSATQSAVPDFAPVWEIAKAIAVGACFWTARMVFIIRDDLREMKHELFGKDGNNGLKSVITRSRERLDTIDARHIALDAVAAAERDLYDGEEKRHASRRLADRVKDHHE